MSNNLNKNLKNYLIVKDKDSKTISYFEYDKINGYNFYPKRSFKDSIDVNKMILVNPSMIEKVIDRKFNKRFERLLRFLGLVYEDGDSTGEGYKEALNEITRLRQEYNNKYRKYMGEEKAMLLEQKLNILEQEVKLRMEYKVDQYYDYENENEIGRRSR